MRARLEVVYFVWDWFEAISQDEDVFEEQLRALQGMFRQSVYGGPTVYAVANSLRRYSHLLSVGRRTHAIRLWEKTGSRDSNDIWWW